MVQDPSHEAFVRGARLFDQGAFFEAHEVWEERWRVETDEASRRLLQGLIQIAAGLHKLVVVRDGASASRLLARGLEKLDGYAEVAEFRAAIGAWARALAPGQLDLSRLPKLGV
jgi:predicted metal-dependent hydrolase